MFYYDSTTQNICYTDSKGKLIDGFPFHVN